MPFYPFFGEGSPTKIDVLKKVGTLIPTSLLEDLGVVVVMVVSSADIGSWWLAKVQTAPYTAALT